MTAYYNEIDPYAAEWLRNLMKAGHIADGEVDERSIKEISPDELGEFTQCHFFAGIGVWSHALRRAGWPDDRPVWTGSCPCQPFSAAGAGKGTADERHLWPHWHWLITHCRPPVVVGEQVASKAGRAWFDTVSADMEALGFAVGGADLCAAGFSGAHIRQRLYFVAVGNTLGAGSQGHLGPVGVGLQGGSRPVRPVGAAGVSGRLELTQHQHQRPAGQLSLGCGDASGAGEAGRLADTECERVRDQGCRQDAGAQSGAEGVGPKRKRLWADVGDDGGGGTAQQPAACAPHVGRTPVDWLFCRDGKWRPVEPGTFPLADAPPQRVGRLRAYGNALDAETAAQFCAAVVEVTQPGGDLA